MFKEFKEFIAKGNVIDLAVGVIIGGAFGKIVTSLVDDILMPIIGIIIGGIDFSNLSIDFLDAKIMYGSFIQQIIDFLIVALDRINGFLLELKRRIVRRKRSIIG